MLKKKKGSALLVTVISFMFVTTVLVAMLSFISSNYKMRVIESKRVENLYTSESGLDIVSTVINKNLSSAINYGKEKVNELGDIKDLPPEKFKEFYNEHEDDRKYDATIMYRMLLDDISYQDYAVSKEKITEETAKENKEKDRIDIEKVKNMVFKQGVKEFLQIKGSDEWDGNELKKIEENDNENVLTKSIENLYYLSGKSTDGTYNTEDISFDVLDKEPTVFVGDKDKEIKTLEEQKKAEARTGIQYWKKVNKEGAKLLPTRELHYFLGDYESADDDGLQVMSWLVNKKNISTSDEEGLKIKVTSEFETNQDTQRIGSNLRTVQSIYDLRIPNYKEIKFETLDNVQLEELFDIPKITVGKNMDVQSNFRIDGDIFVQGEYAMDKKESGTTDEQRKKERLYDKYSGGITLGTNLDKTIEFNGEIATRGTFNIKNNANVILNNDLYAKNLYIGNTNSDPEKNVIKNSTLKAEKSSIVLDNDFTFKGWGTKVSIKDFYGINDKNNPEYVETNITGDKLNQRTSSSIIVNDFDKDSSINIKNSAYLMGVGHINTESGYQTGESVAVKGNYEAYAVAKNDRDKIIYDNPLYVLDENDVFKKSSHFYEYWKDKITDKETGKITLPQSNPSENSSQHPKQGTYSIGAIVNANTPKVLNQNYTNDILGFINSKRKEYADKVYKLKSDNTIASMELYNSLGEGADEVNNLDILNNLYKNKDNIDKIYDIGDPEVKDKFYKAICLYDLGKTIVITNNDEEYKKDKSKYEIFKTDGKSNIINAVVVANSDVIIDGDVQFNGSIITSGNLIIKGSNKVNLKYDKFVVDEVQKENANLFNAMFRNSEEDEEKNKNPKIEANSNEFVKVGLWRIVK